MQNKVELLLPVGTKEMALAAIHNGADAIFIGVPGFNARGRSVDFDLISLKEIIDLCHQYHVKVNLAFNILIFQEELKIVIELLEKILPLNPDAFIVQDLGLVQIIRKMAPHQRVHASTQMTVTNFESIELLSDLNIQRFVLGRENSIEEIKKIREKTSKELETFVHGALCVSYSGQCFTSESLGGRSANRGQCAQSCRFSYDLYVDGQKADLGDRHYLVSPQDLCGIEEVPELIEAGIDCFKIEGRLKTPEYVSTSAKAYRSAIDRAYEKKNDTTSSVFQTQNPQPHHTRNLMPQASSETPTQLKKNMAVSYSRGFFSGWLHGVNHQKLVSAQYSSHRGYELGIVSAINIHSITVTLNGAQSTVALVAGDGVLWALGGQEQGGFIYSVKPISNFKVELELARDMVLNPTLVGATVYQNHDKELKKWVSQTVEDKNLKKRLPISVAILIENNQPLKATITDSLFTVKGQSETVLMLAKTSGISDEQLKDEFNSLSGSLFKLNDIKIERTQPSDSLFISHRELKKLRQTLIAELTIKRQSSFSIADLQITATAFSSDDSNQAVSAFATENTEDSRPKSMAQSKPRISSAEVWNALFPPSLSGSVSTRPLAEANFTSKKSFFDGSTNPSKPRFNVLLRERKQVLDLIDATQSGKFSPHQIDTVILDFEFGRDYQSSLLDLRKAHFKVGLATTRILKPNEYRNIKMLLDLNPDAILVRNLGALHYLNQYNTNPNANLNAIELHGDFSLNVTNHLTAQYFLSKGLNRLCLSYDLNYQQITTLLENTEAQKMEVTIYQHMPSFHMEHCVFAAFLSKGSSYRDCGKPCEKHEVKLKDQFQNWHQIKADPECRNTMYNARPQSATRHLDSWTQLGLGNMRFEALKEQGEELISKIHSYLHFLDQKISHQELLQQLGSVESYGVSEGALIKTQEYKSRKKDFFL